MNVLFEHRVAATLCFVIFGMLILSLLSSTARRQIKKGLVILLTLAGVGLAYYFITGNSPAEIPATIDSFFNGPQAPQEISHKYYRDPHSIDKGLPEME